MKLNLKCESILSRQVAIDFIQEHHYSPVLPKLTKHYLGFFLDGKLRGVLTLGWGTQPKATINKMFNGLDSSHYFEIGKMCMDDDMPKNSESQMMSLTVKWMKEKTDCLFLYTMADGIMGKCGYVYQASNFYFGERYLTDVYMMDNGEKLHPRSTKSLCLENAKELGKERVFWLTSDFMLKRGIKRIKGYMFRYIYPLNKTAKKLLKKGKVITINDKQIEGKLEWTQTKANYPKDKSLEWFDGTKAPKVKIEKPKFVLDLNNIKYNKKNVEVAGNTSSRLPGY
jgi:hypothetical protein